jgi:hypothetical protein
VLGFELPDLVMEKQKTSALADEEVPWWCSDDCTGYTVCAMTLFQVGSFEIEYRPGWLCTVAKFCFLPVSTICVPFVHRMHHTHLWKSRACCSMLSFYVAILRDLVFWEQIVAIFLCNTFCASFHICASALNVSSNVLIPKWNNTASNVSAQEKFNRHTGWRLMLNKSHCCLFLLLLLMKVSQKQCYNILSTKRKQILYFIA